MSGWPAIDEPGLLARLALSDAEFVTQMRGFIAAVGARRFGDAAYETALGYPWPRPPASFLLDGDEMRPLAAWDPGAARERWPLLAFGSNGAPDTLIRKLAHLPPPQRRLPVVAGDLHDFDAGAAAHPAAYGSFPATLFVSPGTALRAAILWVTVEQLTALAWTEASYRLGRLDGVRFVPDLHAAPPVHRALVFSSRWGSHCVDGAVAALAAAPARDRAVPEFTQEDLLGRLAREALGAGAGARDLVAWIYADFAAAAERIAPLTQATARAFASAHWTAFPAG